MGQLTQTTTELQAIVDNSDAANVGKTSLTDGSDTTAVAFKKSGFYSLQGSSSNAPSTDRAVLISAIRDTAATGEIRYGQIAITESNGLWWNRDDGGSLGTWYAAVSTTGTQTLTNKTLTSPVLTTPQINDSAADHQYIFAGSNLVADRTVTLPLLASDDTFVFAAHTQTLTNKTLTTPTVSGLTLSDASIIFEGATADAHETTLTVSDPTADRTITLPDATDTLVGLATTDTLTNKTLTSPVLNTGVSGTAVLNADDFTGASATTLATSESIKAYVDAQVGTVDTLAEVLANGNATDGTNVVVTAGDVITTDTISETTAAAGVTIDGVLLKDDGVNATNLEVTNIKANDGTAAGSIADSTGVVTLASSVLTTTDINGGTIDSAVIGGTTPAAITGTAITATGIMTATGTSVFASLDISGDIDVDGTANLDVVDIDGAVDFGSTTAHAGNATFADNAKAIFGAGSDLNIYHNPSIGSIIEDTGAGALFLRGSNSVQIETTAGVDMLLASEGGAVTAYHNGSEKLATTATGIDVTGTVTADGLTVAATAPNVLIQGVSATDASLTLSSAGITSWALRNESTDSSLYFTQDGTTRAQLASGGDISFYEDTGTTAKFFWDASAERLGLGTTTPAGNLHIEQSGTNPYLRITETGNTGIDFGQETNGNGIINLRDSADLRVFTSATERLRIDSAGNVGIGTDSPNYEMTIAGGTTNSIQIVSSTTGTGATNGLRLWNTGSSTALWNYDNTPTLFGTNNDEAMRLDASGNLLVGTTSQIDVGKVCIDAGTGSNGLVVDVDDATGYTNLLLDRTASDGTFISFNRGATNVGSIQSRAGAVSTIILDPRAGGRGLGAGSNSIVATDQNGTLSNGATDIGEQNFKFRDLYLSGGVYLGGTGAANKLDDYEEGTWTPNIAFGGASVGVTYFAQQGYYTKVGRLVQATGKLYVNSVGSSTGDFTITGLPFTLSASANSDTAVAIRTDAVSYADVPAAFIIAGTSYITFTETTNAGTGSNLTNANIAFGSTITFTASYFV